MIILKPKQLNEIQNHAEKDYPHECCGFLLGEFSDDGAKIVKEIFPISNAWGDESVYITQNTSANVGTEAHVKNESLQNRFSIDPKETSRVDIYAKDHELTVVGYYHSHPDSPAVPSKFDADHISWTTWCYIIVSVKEGRLNDVRAWQPDFDPDVKEFIGEEEISKGD
ncbi:MAG: M67 family metallopeptidase [Pyrinomonadaceae bacterium]